MEDVLDALNWAYQLGGLEALIHRSNKSFEYIEEWIKETSWVDFLCDTPNLRSNTSITFKITEKWFLKVDEITQREIMKKIVDLLSNEKIAYDINGYPKAPPSFRVWGGGTIEPNNIRKLLPWIDWAYNEVKKNYA